MNIHEHVVYSLEPFAADFKRHVEIGKSALSGSGVLVTGGTETRAYRDGGHR
jgi:hypothetical protein